MKSIKKIICLGIIFMCSIFSYSQNNGPNAPEASGFEPVSATDMVNLSSGDMAYVLPLLEVDGFPVTLSYHAGIPMDMEASWVGLGWNINTGAIARGVVANPDDWGIGRRLNLTYLSGEIDSYSVNVGVGIAKAAEVGVGLSWGSNKSISGSVSASVGPLSASIDTNGNYSVGLSASSMGGFGFGDAFDKITDKGAGSGFGGSLSISGNVNKGGIAVNVGIGGSAGGMSAGMGVSISGNGIGTSYSIGANNQTIGSRSISSGASISMNSYSAGDYSYNTKGFYIPIQIGIFNFGFGHQKTKIRISKGYDKFGYGILYHNANTLYNNDLGQDELSGFSGDYQRRNTYGDVYEQSLPQKEEEFIGDYRNQIEKLNFTFGGYDSYDINAPGIGGALKPILGQNIALIGEGYDGASIRTERDKTKVFYHNSKFNGSSDRMALKTIELGDTDVNKLNFSFDGQITIDAKMENASFIASYSGSSMRLSNFITEGTSLESRPKSGSYVETYTNTQIDNGANILIPASLKTSTGVILRNDIGYVMDGIGAYRITTPDGKTYHFSQPVYQYEQVQHNFMHFPDTQSNSIFNSTSKREATPYATHWLLTAITGPDYIDLNNNKFADEGDYGYWLRLDHGHWSNAYAWRSPYDTKDYHNDENVASKSRRHYSTFIDNEVEKSDPGYFIQGRKDLYYLDKIVSKNQTAVFVKDIRYDAYGTSADYVYDPNGFDDPIEINPIESKEYAKYEKEYLLRLDKILIFNKKESEVLIDKEYGNGIDGIFEETPIGNRYHSGGFFDMNLPPLSKIHKLHQSENIIDINDVQNFDYSKVTKVIKFEHSYELAQETPSSGYPNDININNPDTGRLTLESVQTFGRGTIENATEDDLFDFMPPYVFEYKNKTAIHEENQLVLIPPTTPNPHFPTKPQYTLDRANKDNWGFRKDNVDTWSLKKITTPQGATIDIDYEEDDFYIEAFGRKYWENNLQLGIFSDPDPDYKQIHIMAQDGFDNAPDFRNYFDVDERVFIDLCLYRYRRWRTNFCSQRESSGKARITVDDIVTVVSVSETMVVLKFLENETNHKLWGDDGSASLDRFFDKNGQGTHVYDNLPICERPPTPAGGCGSNPADHHNMKYKLLATKTAPGKSGGGLRVKDIVVNDNIGGQYKTSYDYDDPSTGKTSGITSFNPIRGEVFVPYQNELPGPGVMYEWVTMKAVEIGLGGSEKIISKKRYNFYTLQPVFDIFNPDIAMKDVDGDIIFKSVVVEQPMNFSDLTAKKMKIEKNLTKIGQIISIEEFNEFDHLMNKTTNTYSPRDGELSETFSSMKSVFDFDEDSSGNQSNFDLQQHYLSLATKSEKVSILTSIENITAAGKSSITYDNPDPYLGTFTESIRKLADGTEIKEIKIPAYEFYNPMKSKLLNVENKNMLTQQAITATKVNVAAQGQSEDWRVINTQITTWNDVWHYRDNYGNVTTPIIKKDKIWRKHKTFVFKDNLDEYGAYITNFDIKDYNFDFGFGAGDVVDTWIQTSEIKRYSHWSMPIEVEDINNNFATTKMADNWSKVIATTNANYIEMYYSGAEHVAPTASSGSNNWFEGEVLGADYQSSDFAHTGIYSVKNENPNDKVFQIKGEVSIDGRAPDLLLPNIKLRAGKYKVSFWALCNDDERIPSTDCSGIALFLNGTEISSNETMRAGLWKQFNYIVDLTNGSLIDLYVTNKDSSGFYFDDFRMHPIYASMNSYVYDKQTDELSYVLDANNIATYYCYDDASRLCKVFKEVTDAVGLDGGFKLINAFKSHYKDIDVTDCQCLHQNQTSALFAINSSKVTEIDKGTYSRTFQASDIIDDTNYTFEWSWLTDIENNSYSNFIVGSSKHSIPFAPSYCTETSYNKVWDVILKITDNVTNEVQYQKNRVELSGCKFEKSVEKWADLEISTNYDSCNSDTKITFRSFVIKPEHNNYIFEYQTYNPNTNIWSSYIDVSATNGIFCPPNMFVLSTECKYEWIKYYVVRYRVTNTVSGNIYQSNTNHIFTECLDSLIDSTQNLIVENFEDQKYATKGNVLEKDALGKIIRVVNIFDEINNYKK